MRSHESVWQGCSGNWQPLFVREYWLPIGHAAWQGFLSQGRGIVVCEVAGATATVDWRCTAVDYTLRFVAQASLVSYWCDLGLTADQRLSLDGAIATYDPAQDVILLLLADSPPHITCLQGWAVTPPECFRLLSDRAPEFSLAPQP